MRYWHWYSYIHISRDGLIDDSYEVLIQHTTIFSTLMLTILVSCVCNVVQVMEVQYTIQCDCERVVYRMYGFIWGGYRTLKPFQGRGGGSVRQTLGRVSVPTLAHFLPLRCANSWAKTGVGAF